SPIARQLPAMINMVMRRTALRPILSPTKPKNTPPSGLARKPTANTPSVASRAEAGSVGLNKTNAMNGESTAYVLNSYHSKRFPTEAEARERRRLASVRPTPMLPSRSASFCSDVSPLISEYDTVVTFLMIHYRWKEAECFILFGNVGL